MSDQVNKPLLHPILVALLSCLVYSNTFHAPFVFDDLTSIVENPAIRHLSDYLPGGSAYSLNPRRFVGYFTFALNYRIGGLNPLGYHLVNLGIHIAASLLVYAFCHLLFRTPHLRDSSLVPRAGLIALLSALLFAVHPLQTQAVTYITQRLASLATLFYLLALVIYLRANLQAKAGSRLINACSYGAALVAALLALGTKETAFTLPISLLLCEGMFFTRDNWRRWRILIVISMSVAVAALIIVTNGSIAALDRELQAAAGMSRWDYLLTQGRVLTTYLRLLVLPIGQNLDYDYPLHHSLLELPVIASWLEVALLAGGGIHLWRRSSPLSPHPMDPAVRLISFGIFWFFITLTVESGIFPLAELINEHRLYLPSAGVFMAAATAIALLTNHAPVLARPIAFAAALIVLVLSMATWERNLVWHSAISLWRDTVAKSPAKARPHYNLGTVLSEYGNLAGAADQFRLALHIEPNNAAAHHNLGTVYAQESDLDKAIAEYRTALRLNPKLAEAHNSLGSAYSGKGDLDLAIAEYREAIRLAPGHAAAHNNLGAALGMQGRLELAIGELREAVRLEPDNPTYHDNLRRAEEELRQAKNSALK